jgi:hypothetical protein
LIRLVDMSLVVPDVAAGWYQIADPIAEAVQREFRDCTREEYQRVASALEVFLAESRDEAD